MKLEEIKYWGIREWQKYLDKLACQITDVEMRKNTWRLEIGVNGQQEYINGRTMVTKRAGISIILPLIK